MELKKYKFGSNMLEMLLFISALCLLIFLLYRLIKSANWMSSLRNPSSEDDQIQDDQIQDDQLQEPTEHNPIPTFYAKVLSVLPEYDSDFQEFITAQAMHETGIFTSPLFLKYNNAFGMKQPTQRKTTSKGISESGYATYASVEDSIADMDLYFQAKQYPDVFANVSEYVIKLKEKGYFEATLKSYTNAVAKHLNAVKPFAQ